MRWYCNCGAVYSKLTELKQHIGLLNPHWPRSSPEDEHWSITQEEYKRRKKEKRDEQS